MNFIVNIVSKIIFKNQCLHSVHTTILQQLQHLQHSYCPKIMQDIEFYIRQSGGWLILWSHL